MASELERVVPSTRNRILSHPRGRIYNYRLGLRADRERVFALATKLDKALEIDAYPDRQDMSPHLLVPAKKAEVPHFSSQAGSTRPEPLEIELASQRWQENGESG
jgi:histidinol phosphatase-like PHP family hydrolase